MKVANRVFFRDEAEARARGYRPCGHCLRAQYRSWKASPADGQHKDRHR
jgi:methylphosphotriester-DNA--protein-cysteine methyltransferase